MAEVKNAPEKRRGNRVAAFLKDQKAATAVEFALIAAPFLAITIALIQTFLVFFAQAVLENVARSTSRLIMTGQVQTQQMTASAFTTIVCNQGSILFRCPAAGTGNGLMVDVQVANGWSSANTGMPSLTYDSSGNVTTASLTSLQFNPGNAGDIVVVRVIYLWPVFFGPIAFNMANQANGTRMIMASAAFQNEPAAP
jgi:Flp pilus assembly protein TadG